MPKDTKGYNPIWFSDNVRILFYTLTGKNPSNLEGAKLEDICILDTSKPENKKLLGYEQVYRGCKWIIKDELVWIDSGWDDGHYAGLLDLNSFQLTDFGDSDYNYYQDYNKDINFILYDDLAGYQLLTRDMDTLGTFTVEENGQQWNNSVLSLLPDRRLLYLKSNLSEMKGAIMLSFLNEYKYIQLAGYEGSYYPIVSKDGSKIALVDDHGDNFIVIDTLELGGLGNTLID